MPLFLSLEQRTKTNCLVNPSISEKDQSSIKTKKKIGAVPDAPTGARPLVDHIDMPKEDSGADWEWVEPPDIPSSSTKDSNTEEVKGKRKEFGKEDDEEVLCGSSTT